MEQDEEAECEEEVVQDNKMKLKETDAETEVEVKKKTRRWRTMGLIRTCKWRQRWWNREDENTDKEVEDETEGEEGSPVE